MPAMILQAICAEGVGHHDLCASLDVCPVYRGHSRWILDIPIRRILARRQSRSLNHRPETAIQKRHVHPQIHLPTLGTLPSASDATDANAKVDAATTTTPQGVGKYGLAHPDNVIRMAR